MALAYSIARKVARSRKAVVGEPVDAVDPYAMTNLFPRTTGLPLTILAGPRGDARHDARIKVCLTPGKMDMANLAVVGIRPEPRLIKGRISTSDFELIARWIALNEDALLALWNGTIDGAEFGARLTKLEPDGVAQPTDENQR